MKQIHRAKRHRGSASGRQEPLAADPRDPDIVHAHRITRPQPSRCRPAAVRQPPPRRAGPRTVAGHGQLPGPADHAGNGTG